MAIILRADVDKPYGKHNFLRKVCSKIKEDFLPNVPLHWGYLSHLKEMLVFCNEQKISGTFYHRLCTIPDAETLELLKEGNHEFGLHLENSKSSETFAEEWSGFLMHPGCKVAKSFSKHGSGVHKLGKYHYPIYEPEKYLEWAGKQGYLYPSGNGIAEKGTDLFSNMNGWFPNLFWLESDYRSPSFSTINELIEVAKENTVVVLIHPCNFKAEEKTRNEFYKMVDLAKNNNIKITSFKENIH
jgi:hypothetical protein